ncbi:hypothetical protein ACFQ5C_25720, partial [Methylobacterium goesingense]
MTVQIPFVQVPFETHAAALRAPEAKSALPLLEDKSAGHAPHDPAVSGAMAELSRAFEAFKETNDARLAAIEGRAPGDVLTDEKLARIDAALDTARTRLDRLTLDGQRPPLGAGAPAPC